MFKQVILSVLFWFITTSAWSTEMKIRVVTEDAFPLQYKEAGELKGPALSLVEAVLTKAELDYTVEVLPWARAYAIATAQANTLIFSMARTPEREAKFHWLGALMELSYYFYGLKTNFPQDKYVLNDFKQVRIGTIFNSATYQFLNNNGFTRLLSVTSPEQNFKKLFSSRIDVFPANVTSFEASCLRFKQDCSRIKQLAPLTLPAKKLYFALSKGTEQTVVKRISQAYQAVLAEQALTTGNPSIKLNNTTH